MAVNKLLEQRNNNSSELLEQLDAYETFEEINRRIEREHREWRSSLDRQIDGYYDYNIYDREWERRHRLSPKNRIVQEEIARQRAINEIEQELRDAGKIDDRPWWRRLLRL